jgi:general nucleoside transport system permease protein
MTTTTKSPNLRSASANRWITGLLTVIGLVALWWMLGLVIGGQCDANCISGNLSAALRYATPIAFAAFCGLMCERAGVVNIGIEGQMLMAAMVAYAVNLFSFQFFKAQMNASLAGDVSRYLALLAAVLSSVLLAALHAVVTIRFKADQIISGTVLNIMALGVTGFCYRQFLAENLPAGPGTFPIWNVPLLSQIPILGPVLFQQKLLTYTMLILTLAIHYVMFYTTWGLRTRAVGEHPRAADTLGVNVFFMRYANVLIGGVIAGLGGAWFTLEGVDVFTAGMTNGIGFIGLAAMIFGKWSPFGALVGALIFGLGNSITSTVSIFRSDIPSQIPQMLPYLLTIIVLTGVVGRAIPPAADGTPYEKQ